MNHATGPPADESLPMNPSNLVPAAQALSEVELFALEKLWQGHGVAVTALKSPAARVLERVETPTGFYSVIQLARRIDGAPQPLELTWRFRLKRLKRSGYFVCWMDGESRLCLEAVLSGGTHPARFAEELLA